jgi:tryptophan-rich sensory protein
MKNKGFNFKVFIICLLIVFLIVGGVGSLFTTKNVNSSWYQSIQPAITPPNWVFPIAWNILFLLISFSLYFAWMSSKSKRDKKKVAIVFGINFVLNILWSVLFFGLKETQIAFIEIILLWISILAMILITKNISKKSSWLLVPYLIWVTFASVLNYMAAFA